MVKNLPVRQEIRVQSLGWKVLLEKGMAIQSSILAWRIPWTKKPGRLVCDMIEQLTHTHILGVVLNSFQIENVG